MRLLVRKAGPNVYAFVLNNPIGLSDPDGEPTCWSPLGKPPCPPPPCPGGKPKVPRWQDLDYSSAAACVGDNTFSPPVQVGLGIVGIGASILGGPVGAIVGAACGGTYVGNELQGMLYCNEMVCPGE